MPHFSSGVYNLAALSMKLVKGDTLAGRRVEKTELRFEVDEIRDWGREMAEALQYAHNEAEIVHRSSPATSYWTPKDASRWRTSGSHAACTAFPPFTC